jgi:hypothetical protein
MSKVRLQVEYSYDFCLIGIACLEKDYRLCWLLNNLLSLKLSKAEDHVSSVGNHSMFCWVDEAMYREYYLISNKSDTSKPLAEEHQHTDYFLIVKGELEEEEKKYFSEQIKTLSTVSASYQIDPNTLKSKHNLIL